MLLIEQIVRQDNRRPQWLWRTLVRLGLDLPERQLRFSAGPIRGRIEVEISTTLAVESTALTQRTQGVLNRHVQLRSQFVCGVFGGRGLYESLRGSKLYRAELVIARTLTTFASSGMFW